MYSYNRIHNDYDTNVVRVELNSSYRPHTTMTATTLINRAASREPLKITSSSTTALNRGDTFTKHDRERKNENGSSTGIVRSETFIVKHHDNSSDDQQQQLQRRYEQGYDDDNEKHEYGTFTRSKKKSLSRSSHNGGANEGKYDRDDKSNYSTYTRKEKRGNEMRCLFLFSVIQKSERARETRQIHTHTQFASLSIIIHGKCLF